MSGWFKIVQSRVLKQVDKECDGQTYLVKYLVSFNTDEVAHIVKVHLPELSTSVQLGAEFSPNLHYCFEHLIVAVTSEQDLTGIQLIKGATNGPHIDSIVVRQT